MGNIDNSGARKYVEARLNTIVQRVGRELPPHPPLERTPEEQHRHLYEETQELYENEMAWEEEFYASTST